MEQIIDAFIKNEHLTAIFFNLEKAYDTAWKYRVMKALFDLNIKGRFLMTSYLKENSEFTLTPHFHM